MYSLALIAVVFLAVLIWKSTRRPKSYPPGPPLLPLVGNVLSLDLHRPDKTFGRWAEHYGPVFSVHIGAVRQVVLSDPDIIRDAFSRPEVTDRPDTQFFRFMVEGKGLGASSGQLWQESRRFTLHHLKNLGMGRSAMEETIRGQVVGFMEQVLLPNCGQPVSVDKSLSVSVLNIIWQLVSGEQLALDDHHVHEAIQHVSGVLGDANLLVLLDAFPTLSRLLPRSLLKMDRVEEDYREAVRLVLAPALERHRQRLADQPDTTEPADYIDCLLLQQRQQPELFTDWHLLMCILDLFLAGTETTTATLLWALCFLCQRPDWQCRLQEEVDRVVGSGRLPSLSDRPRMPCTEAFLAETQRRGDVAALAIQHVTSAQIQLAGYTIPVDTEVVANLRGVHHNPAYFPQPLEFRPERFLDVAGRFVPSKSLMPFSVGRRQCLGEALARAELFVFLTSLLQQYSFHWPDGFKHNLSQNTQSTAICVPQRYLIVPELRQ